MSNRLTIVEYRRPISSGLIVFLSIVGFFVWLFEIGAITLITLGWLAILL